MVVHKHCFPFIVFLDLDIVVYPPEIHLGEHFSFFEFIDELEDKREGVIVFDCVLI